MNTVHPIVIILIFGMAVITAINILFKLRSINEEFGIRKSKRRKNK